MFATASLPSHVFLRRVLWIDAIAGIGTGLLQLTLTEQMAQLLGLPAVLIQGTGLGLFAFVALAIYVATRPTIPQTPLLVLIVLNGLWAMGCVWVAFGAGLSPTPVGIGNLLVQAVFVVGLVTLQTKGLRQLGA